MPPEFCSDHGEICEKIGSVHANVENLCADMKDVKEILKGMSETKIKVRVLWTGIGGAGLAAISVAKDQIVKFFSGQ
jgi:shikimate 5-dehydrogenase